MKRFTATFTFACLCAAATAGAAEWSAAPALSWTVDHDTNRFLSDDPIASQGGLLQIEALLKRTTGRSTYSLFPRMGWQQYTEHDSRKPNSQSLQAAAAWRAENSVIDAQAGYSRDNSVNGELAETGLLTGSTLRRSKFASLSWSHEQSDRSRLDVLASYSDIEYETRNVYALFGFLFPYESLYGYQYPSVSVTQTHQWSPRTTLQFDAYAARLVTQGAGDSDNFGGHVGISRALTAHVNLFASVGVSRQEAAGWGESGYIGRFGSARRNTLGQWRVYAERSVAASGYGVLVNRDDIGLSLDRRLTPHWSATLGLRRLSSADIGAAVPGISSGEHRRYERAETSLYWQMRRAWRVSANASFTRASQGQDSSLVEAWRAALSATWSPQPRLLSR